MSGFGRRRGMFREKKNGLTNRGAAVLRVHQTDIYGPDIYTETVGDVDTLANLGPLQPLGGIWEGTKGPTSIRWRPDRARRVHGALRVTPDRLQTNGPQLFYGMRYHTHVLKPGEQPTFHDQVGYWLWRAAAGAVTLTLGSRGGRSFSPRSAAEPDASSSNSRRPSAPSQQHCVEPLLERPSGHELPHPRTVNGDGTWSYEEEGVLEIPGRTDPFHHIDSNTLSRVGPAVPTRSLPRLVGSTSE